MMSAPIIANLKRVAIPVIALALALVLLAWFATKSPSNKTAPGQVSSVSPDDAGNDKEATAANINTQNGIGSAQQEMSGPNHLASVTVIIMNNEKNLPLGIKVGNKHIKIPGPSTWSQGGDAEKGRFIAAIIDTADVLKANGFKADDVYSFVVGGTELNAANTFRAKGNDQPDTARTNDNDYSEEFRTQRGEDGIWRALRFKNVILSHAQVPSLEDHLVLPAARAAENVTGSMPGSATGRAAGNIAANTAPAKTDAHAAQVTPIAEPDAASARKYVAALDSPDPAVRADAIENLMLNGYAEATDQTKVDTKSIVEKALLDTNPTVRETALDSLDGMENAESIPKGALSHVALNDKNPAFRIQALNLLADHFGEQALSTLQAARNDPDPRVGQLAKALIDDIKPPE